MEKDLDTTNWNGACPLCDGELYITKYCGELFADDEGSIIKPVGKNEAQLKCTSCGHFFEAIFIMKTNYLESLKIIQ